MATRKQAKFGIEFLNSGGSRVPPFMTSGARTLNIVSEPPIGRALGRLGNADVTAFLVDQASIVHIDALEYVETSGGQTKSAVLVDRDLLAKTNVKPLEKLDKLTIHLARKPSPKAKTKSTQK